MNLVRKFYEMREDDVAREYLMSDPTGYICKTEIYGIPTGLQRMLEREEICYQNIINSKLSKEDLKNAKRFFKLKIETDTVKFGNVLACTSILISVSVIVLTVVLDWYYWILLASLVVLAVTAFRDNKNMIIRREYSTAMLYAIERVEKELAVNKAGSYDVTVNNGKDNSNYNITVN
jgi:hypothetical protein